MKKAIVVLAAIILILSVAACDKKNETIKKERQTKSVSKVETESDSTVKSPQSVAEVYFPKYNKIVTVGDKEENIQDILGDFQPPSDDSDYSVYINNEIKTNIGVKDELIQGIISFDDSLIFYEDMRVGIKLDVVKEKFGEPLFTKENVLYYFWDRHRNKITTKTAEDSTFYGLVLTIKNDVISEIMCSYVDNISATSSGDEFFAVTDTKNNFIISPKTTPEEIEEMYGISYKKDTDDPSKINYAINPISLTYKEGKFYSMFAMTFLEAQYPDFEFAKGIQLGDNLSTLKSKWGEPSKFSSDAMSVYYCNENGELTDLLSDDNKYTIMIMSDKKTEKIVSIMIME